MNIKKVRRCKSSAVLTVTNLQEADKVLAELAELERRADSITNGFNASIDNAKNKVSEEMSPINSRKKILETALKSFATLNKGHLFKHKKTIDLNFGVLSFRQSSKIVTAARSITFEMVLERLKKLNYLEGIRIKEEVNKDMLGTWDDEMLEEIGAKRKTDDIFAYQLKQYKPEQINE